MLLSLSSSSSGREPGRDGRSSYALSSSYSAGRVADRSARWVWSPDSTKLLLNYNEDAEGDQTLIDPVTGASSVLPWHAGTEPDWQRRALGF